MVGSLEVLSYAARVGAQDPQRLQQRLQSQATILRTRRFPSTVIWGLPRCVSFRSRDKTRFSLHRSLQHAEHQCSDVHGDCDFSYGPKSERWYVGDSPTYTPRATSELTLDANMRTTIEDKLNELDPALRELSKKIHGPYASSTFHFQVTYTLFLF